MIQKSDAALSCFAVREERVQLRKVHHDCIPLAQVEVFQVVLVTLVLGEINKHLKEAKRIIYIQLDIARLV